MQHWSQIATRNWRVKRVRTAGSVLAIALGTGAVVWVTCCYESVRQTMLSWAGGYIGNSHITVQSQTGQVRRAARADRLARSRPSRACNNVAPLLVQRLPSATESAHRDQAGSNAYPTMWDVDFHGIDLSREFAVRDWDKRIFRRPNAELSRRSERLRAGAVDRRGATRRRRGQATRVGHRLRRGRANGAGNCRSDPPGADRSLPERRLALLRLPVLQQISQKQALVNSIDVVVADPTPG